jgi:IRSp53/MIM homology domain
MASVELHQLQDMQALEEEKSKLEGFCEKGLKNVRWHKTSFQKIKIKILIFYQAMTQERRRYGFILERQCVLAKHVLSYHSLGSAALQRNMDDWKDVARSRDILPDNVQLAFANKLQVTSLILFWTKFNAKFSIDILANGILARKGNLLHAQDVNFHRRLGRQLLDGVWPAQGQEFGRAVLRKGWLGSRVDCLPHFKTATDQV